MQQGQKPVIGVFDSGVGGLSVVRHIRRHLPGYDILYVADSDHVPYGEKSSLFIQQRSLAICEFLLQQGAKALVVACNTATAAAIDLLRWTYTVPVIGMEPGVKPAVAASQSGKVGILATSSTLHSEQYKRLVNRYGKEARVIAQPCPGLVECVEGGELEGDNVRRLLHQYIDPLLKQGVDTLVLGCTHYPFLTAMIRQLVGPAVTLIDTGEAVARQVQRSLADHVTDSAQGECRIWVNSQDLVSATARIQQLVDFPVSLQQLPEPYAQASATGAAPPLRQSGS